MSYLEIGILIHGGNNTNGQDELRLLDDEDLQSIMHITGILGQCQQLLLRAETEKYSGDLETAKVTYEDMIALNREYLRLAQIFNEKNKDYFEIPPIVQPLVNAMFMQADVHESLGDLARAESYREEGIGLSKEYLDSSGLAEMERSRADSLISQGRFNEALIALTSSRDLFQNQGNVIKTARTMMDIASLHRWLGDNDRATEEFQRAAQLIEGYSPQARDPFKAIEEGVELERIMIELPFYRGLILQSLERYDEAEELFLEVLPFYDRLGSGPAVEYQIAKGWIKVGRLKDGLSFIKRLEPRFRREDLLRSRLAAVLKVKGEGMLGMERYEEAVNTLQEGIEDLDKYYNPDLLWQLQWFRARGLERLKRHDEAITEYEAAVSTINNLRRAPLGYRLDSTYLADKVQVYYDAIDLASRMGNAEKCLHLMEMIKSRILTTTLSIPLQLGGPKSSDIEERFDRIVSLLEALEFDIYKNGPTVQKLEKKKEMLKEHASLLERMRFSDPRWRSLTEPIQFELETILRKLSDRSHAALSMFLFGNNLVTVLLKDRSTHISSVELPDNVLMSLERYHSNLQMVGPDMKMMDISVQTGLTVDRLIDEALISKALESKGLIIVPHGLLHLLPWAGLEYHGRRLFEHCPIGILPNLSCILALEREVSKEPRVALIGPAGYEDLPTWNNLELTQMEIENIRDTYSDHDRVIGVISSGNTTKEDFWRLARHEDSAGGILHIACHGTLDAEDPMNSGLILADSKITASAIGRGRLRYDEVVLSACSTGWRPATVEGIKLLGDDILGLPGAFLESGVRSILVSIPPASELATLTFMEIFHENRVDGMTPMESLQATQIQMKKDATYPMYLWIGFTLYGCQ